MSDITIKISKNFHKMPMGRYYPKDGDYTGDKFRWDWLEPNFEKYDKLIIDLDDLYGCPSSFREEAFGGLARIYGINEVLEKLEFVTTDFPELIDVIKNDILEAKKKEKLFK